MMTRWLVVNGDDFGLSCGTTCGIARAHACGVLTSASLMVRGRAAPAAAAYTARHPDLAVGLHLDLGEWIWKEDDWRPLYAVVNPDNADEVELEAWRQLNSFRGLLARNPTHLDSHQHVHRREPVRTVLLKMADSLNVPLRECTAGVRYCGDFYGQTLHGSSQVDAVCVEALLRLLASLPPGTTELACHPATRDDMAGMYRHERCLELQTLCDRRVRDALCRDGISLRSFHDLCFR
jgi:predicted glycoside hydrolase/deacetylase ChbG (UPF0249 family)